MNSFKNVDFVQPHSPSHWVGDGFPVTSVFSPQSVGSGLSPYVLFDYAEPASFEPSHRPRGVDSHPHRGFETVTVVFQGELEHRDSAGHSGCIGPGDVQWMTAASGVLHEEKHSAAFTRHGGVLEMAQLWVNLPAKHKMDPPRYQELRKEAIPTASLPHNAGTIRIIAGNFNGWAGAAQTLTPVVLWDVILRKDAHVTLPMSDGNTAAVFVRRGNVTVSDTHSISQGQLAALTRKGAGFHIHAEEVSHLLILGGQPIDEPVVTYGPFVMNTTEEIQQALSDARAGRFGTL